jgi:hypothetical protein
MEEEEPEESFTQHRWGVKYRKVKGRGELIWSPNERKKHITLLHLPS